jgi:hypothetical protein
VDVLYALVMTKIITVNINTLTNLIYLILNCFVGSLKLLALISVFQLQVDSYHAKEDVYINFVDSSFLVDDSVEYYSSFEVAQDGTYCNIKVTVQHDEDFIMYLVFHELFHYMNYIEWLNDSSTRVWTEEEVDERTYEFLNLYKNK